MKINQRIKELQLTGTELVVQDNRLIDSPKMVTLQEQKLFLFLISKLDPKNSEDIVFRIPIAEFAKAIGVESTTDIYRDIRKAIKRLMERVITINGIEDGCKTITDIPILCYAKYWCGRGYADIKISEEIAPYLFALKREFTQYKLSQITMLSSIYAIRIYEMLKKQEPLGKRTFFVNDLRKKLNIADNKLKAFKDFRLYVLNIAKREINLKTDLNIDFKFIKTGRKVTAIEFDIKSKDKTTEKQQNLNFLNTNNKKNTAQVREVMQCGFQFKQANEMLDYTDYSDAEYDINALKTQIKKGNSKNHKAMIKSALKKKWHDQNTADNKKSKPSKTIKESIPRKNSLIKFFEYLLRKNVE
jgi:plasmid replication initiation protein